MLVRDAVNRQPLPGASLDIYVNHTLSGSFHTAAPAGETLLQVPYSNSLTLLGRKDGYLPGPLPWSVTKKPREYEQQQHLPLLLLLVLVVLLPLLQRHTPLCLSPHKGFKKGREASRKLSVPPKSGQSNPLPPHGKVVGPLSVQLMIRVIDRKLRDKKPGAD